MTKRELMRLSDRELLVLLHERVDSVKEDLADYRETHEREHRAGTNAFRWTLGILITALVAIFTIAGVVANLGNP
jgi:Flp pilus assembly protein TadB